MRFRLTGGYRAASHLDLRPGLTFQDEAKAAAVKDLDLDWICQEVEWLRHQLSATASDSTGDGSSAPEERAKRFLSEVVLCHNDLLSGNVLHAAGWDRVQVSEEPQALLCIGDHACVAASDRPRSPEIV